MTGDVNAGEVGTETTVRNPPNDGEPRSDTLQEVPTETEPSPADTVAGDWSTDALMNPPPPPPAKAVMPPPPPPAPKAETDPKAAVRVAAKSGYPKAGPVTNLSAQER